MQLEMKKLLLAGEITNGLNMARACDIKNILMNQHQLDMIAAQSLQLISKLADMLEVMIKKGKNIKTEDILEFKRTSLQIVYCFSYLKKIDFNFKTREYIRNLDVGKNKVEVDKGLLKAAERFFNVIQNNF